MNMSRAGERLIVCMGPLGSGKSAFVSCLGGSPQEAPPTLDLEPSRITVDGKEVILIDTPGFDGTERTYQAILRLLANYFATRPKTDLTGLIYFHRISDNPVSGETLKHIQVFKSTFGADALRNAVLCTTMRDSSDPAMPDERERQPSWEAPQPLRMTGIPIVRHVNTHDGALAVLRPLLLRSPVAVQLQQEILKNARLESTTAWRTIEQHERQRAQALCQTCDSEQETPRPWLWCI